MGYKRNGVVCAEIRSSGISSGENSESIRRIVLEAGHRADLSMRISQLAEQYHVGSPLAWLFGTISLFRARSDAVQIFTMLRDMLNHAASDFSREGEITGWTAQGILRFVTEEENYMSDQMNQMTHIDDVGMLLSPLMIGAVVNTVNGYVYSKSFEAYYIISIISLAQESYLAAQGDGLP
jgi:hypothetical protein